MKTPSVLLLLLFCISASSISAQTYTLNWGSSFSPAWSDGHITGSASNIGGSGINTTVTLTKSGGAYSYSEVNGGVMTPTVSGTAFVVGGSSSNLEIAMDFDSHFEYTDIVYQFSTPVTAVSFEIADIDKPAATSMLYIDEVVISATNGAISSLPTLTKYDATSDTHFLVISGNTANANPTSGLGGNSASTPSDQKGTIIANFGANLVSTITIRYKNATGAQNDPPAQGIAIGNLSFQKTVNLPVTFTYIKAKAQADKTLIQWQTAMEYNNSHFEVEKSFNSQVWTGIATVQGAGNSSVLRDYSFTDPVIETGTTHYRIKQVDLDGGSKFSSVASVTRTVKHVVANVFPNPVDASSVITYYSDHPEEVKLTLLDIRGRTLAADIWPVSKGTNEILLSQFGQLPKGHYILHLYSSKSDYSKAIKLLK